MYDTDTLTRSTVTATAPVSNLPDEKQLRRVDGRVSRSSALIAAAAWITAIAIVDAVAPAADPDAILGGFELFMSLAFTTALMVGAVGLATRQRIGVMATVAGGGLFVLGSVSCWMGGHVGSWIAVQAVLGGALMLLGVGLLRRN